MNARVRALFAAQEVPDREVAYPASVELMS
jgi:hypothetical protein